MAKKLERVKTGVPGLDSIIGGGIPEENVVVVSGEPGSGKTILSMEFLYYGATKFDEPGIFISLEETKEEILKMASLFGWDFEGLVKKRKLDVIPIELYDFNQLKYVIEDSIAKIKAKRIVIDPGVIFRLYFKNDLEARKKILNLGKMLKTSKCTSLITNEALDPEGNIYGLEEYVADGVIVLSHKKVKDKFVRSIAVLKMRNTKISERVHPLVIGKSGVKVLPTQEIFDES